MAAPARVAAVLTSIAGLAAAIAVPLADIETTSIVGIATGGAMILGAVWKWLDGNKQWEFLQEIKTNPELLQMVEMAKRLEVAPVAPPAPPEA